MRAPLNWISLSLVVLVGSTSALAGENDQPILLPGPMAKWRYAKELGVENFGRDVTRLAAEGKLDPIFGRDAEIYETMTALQRRTKPNPVLIGEPGVGKTAIVEGLAQMIVNRDPRVPEALRDCRIVELRAGDLVSGTMYRGQFEERLNAALKELSDPNIVVFVDEMHMLMGLGAAGGKDKVDAANMLKPRLARGEIKVIGATTLDEYRNLEKDGAFERRLRPVYIEEPKGALLEKIVKGRAAVLEAHHNVTIGPVARDVAQRLATRYITGRRNPDSTLDVLDEAAAKTRIDGKKRLTERQIRAVVQKMTGIRLVQSGQGALEIGSRLKGEVIGQDPAIESVSDAVTRAVAGLADPTRPLGSFLFAGPAGVGKTTLARKLAREQFGSEEAVVEINLAEYQDHTAVNKLIGAPPGYVDSGRPGKLTEPVRRRPASVVLFKNLDLGAPVVQDLVLRILRDGQIGDGHGKNVDFKNTIVIATTRLSGGGKPPLGFPGVVQKTIPGTSKTEVMAQLRGMFQGELLNGFDSIQPFNHLGRTQLQDIASLQMKEVAQRLNQDHRIKLTWNDETLAKLAEIGYQPEFGAKPLVRAIQDSISTPLSKRILRREFRPRSVVAVSVKDGQFEFSRVTAKPGGRARKRR